MNKRKFPIFILMLCLVVIPQQAEARTKHHTPHKPHHSAGVDSNAAYADLVIDADTGRVIHDTDADGLRHPASLTKMMTLYITFQALEAGRLSLGQYLPVSENASYQSPSKLGLHAGQHIRVEDAILGLVTESANDAAVVLGEAIGGTEDGFGQLMTRQARALGMSHTVFRNPSGLPDPDQVTSAHDMAVLGDALIKHYPQYYPYFDRDSFTYAGIYHHNHNHLKDRYDGMDGIKTGYIRASGFNLVASAKRGGIRLIGVVFGGRSAVARDNHMAELLDASFTEAQAEAQAIARGGGHVNPPTNGEGDSADNDSDDYIALPAKVAAIFPPRGAVVAPQVPVQADVADPNAQAQAAPQPAAPTPVAPQAIIPQATMQKATVTVVQPAPHPAVNPNAWGIQIGAYSDPAIGQQALSSLVAEMPDQLGKAAMQVQPVSAAGTPMYRARLMSLEKKTAQSVCSYLIQRGKSCLTVEP